MNNFGQAGARWRAMEEWEREDLVSNLVGGLKPCGEDIQQRMLWYFSQADADYGRRVAEGLGVSVPTSPPPGTKDTGTERSMAGGAPAIG